MLRRPLSALVGRSVGRIVGTVWVLSLGLALPVAAAESPAEEPAQDSAEEPAPELRLDAMNSSFVVVTHKAGLAAGMAHEHVVTTERFDARLELDRDALDEASLELTVATKNLVVDAPRHVEALEERLLAAGALEEAATVPDEKDRKKIRQSMLAEDQLDAEAHPEIHATAHGLRLLESPDPDTGTHVTKIALEVRGETVETEMPVTVTFEEGMTPDQEVIVIEGTTTFAFSDFGIEPYSAFFGAVKVADTFHAYVYLVAR